MLDVAALIPVCYAPFRPLVVEGLQRFVAALTPARRAAILSEQVALGDAAPLEARAVALLARCPTLHKLGQVLARHPRLDPALRAQLQRLESIPPSLTTPELRPLVARDLGDATVAALTLGASPLAEGSVAVVLPFTAPSLGDGEPAEGVLKILKPGVEDLIEEELAIAATLGDWLESRSVELELPAVGYAATLEQVARLLRAEIDPASERAHLKRAAVLYGKDARVRIPRLLPFQGERITAMERVSMRKITEADVASPADARRLAQRLVEALLAKPFFHVDETALFHGDPHAGNLLLDEDGRIVLIDWSLAGTLDGRARHAVTVVLVGALTLNQARIREGLRALLHEPLDEAALERVVAAAMDEVPWRRLPGFDWLVGLLDDVAFAGGRFPQELTLFRKALFTLNGVFNDVSEDASMTVPLARTAALQFYRELLPRLLIPGRARTGIALTNTELALLGTSWPITASRYWLDALRTARRKLGR